MTRRSQRRSSDLEIRRSVVGCDAGLVTFGIAHVARALRGDVDAVGAPGILPYALAGAGVYLAREPDPTARETVAEQTAHRVHDLAAWLRRCLAYSVSQGAELVAAERYEHVRESSAAAKAAAGHAALVLECARLDPRPSAQRYGCGCPEYHSARDVKRAVTGCDVADKRVVRRAVERLVAGARERLAEMRVADAAHLADACAVALCALGHAERALTAARNGQVPPLMGRPDFFEGAPSPSEIDGRAVVVAGTWMRRALKVAAGPPLIWREERIGEARFMAALLPGPADRFWRSEANARMARLFLRAAARPT